MSITAVPFANLQSRQPPEAPVISSYGSLVEALSPDGWWRFNGAAGSTFVDRAAGNNGAWTGSLNFQLPPIAQNNADGSSVGLKGGAYGEVVDLTTSASFTIDVALQLDRKPPVGNKAVILTTGGGSTPGEVSIEIVGDVTGDDAYLRFWSVPATGAIVIWRTAESTVPVGEAIKLSMIRNGATGGFDAYVNGESVSKTLESGAAPASWPAAPSAVWRLGEWTGSSSAYYEGLVSELVVWNVALAQASIQVLDLPQNATWLDDFNAGTLISSTVTAIDLTPYAHPVTGATVTVVSQPSLGSATVDGMEIDFSAGATTGADSLTARITANSVQSRTATIGATVADEASGGDAWTNGWSQLGAVSSSVWMPIPFDKNILDGEPTPGENTYWGIADHEGRNNVFYRENREGEPVWNRGYRPSLSLPSGLMAVHLELWQYIPSNAQLAIGKRIGFEGGGGAGGGSVAGVTDTTASGLALPGGWSARYTPNRRFGSAAPTPNRHAIYFYPQDRISRGAPGAGVRLFGATVSSPEYSIIIGEWVRLNFTIILNSQNNADGRMLLWQNGSLMIDVQNILWQEDIASNPISSLWWSWMWGGSEEAFPPPLTWREYYGDARIGTTSRANALANPLPQ